MSSGAELFVDGPKLQDELMDYERVPERGEAFMYVAMRQLDGEAFGPLMRLFRQFLRRAKSAG